MEKKKISGDTITTLVNALSTDYTTADISESERAALDYAVILTQTPEKITQSDVNQLREQGFNDRAIHDICAVTSYFAFVNRIADGLGVELESRFD